MDPELQIQFIAKWICIFCFKMKGAAVFDWTVLHCDHLVCMDCFKKKKDFLKTMRSCHCGPRFLESAYDYVVTHTHTSKMAVYRGDAMNSVCFAAYFFLTLFSFTILIN